MGKAIEQNKLKVELINFRSHGLGKHQKVDDTPFGGGPPETRPVEDPFGLLQGKEPELEEPLPRRFSYPVGIAATGIEHHPLVMGFCHLYQLK